MNDMLKAVYESICSAQDRTQTYANKAHKKVTFEKGDFVFLKVPAKLKTMKTGKCDKLSPRYCDPFKIVKKIGDVAYKLELPESSQVHPVFHISKLKKIVHGLENVVSSDILVDLIEPPKIPHEPERILGAALSDQLRPGNGFANGDCLGPVRVTLLGCRILARAQRDTLEDYRAVSEVQHRAI
ncbi:hypothetical protein L7F22_026982 [Adiantum nelumboides]|nr:hypothetical protein [Adiantum nelumboides]